MMKLAIIFHSESGNTKEVAQLIAQGAEKIEGVESRCMSISEVDKPYINKAKAVIFGSPTYHANLTWKMKRWFDEESSNYDFKGKIGAMYGTENFLGGGADMSLLTMAGHLLVNGMLVYSGGAAAGKPYTHYGAVTIQNGNQKQQERAVVFGERIAKKAVELFG